MVTTITPDAYRTAMAAHVQQESEAQSAGEGGARAAAASDDDEHESPSKAKTSATPIVVKKKKTEEAQGTVLSEDTAGDDVGMSSSPQSSSAAAAIAAAPKGGGAVATAPQEYATMEPGEISSYEGRPPATSNVAESKSEWNSPSPSPSQYKRLDDPDIPVDQLAHYEGESSDGDDHDDRRDQAQSSGNASPLEEKGGMKRQNWPPSPPPNHSPMDSVQSDYSPPYSLAGSTGSARDHDRRRHGRDNRAKPMVITNVWQRDEDRQIRRNEPELYPWMPSRRDLELLNGYRSPLYPLALFDGGPLHRDTHIAHLSWHDQRKYLVDIFRSRWYRGPRSNDRSATALVQAWDPFVTNVNYAGGIMLWENKLLAIRKKFEDHSEVGARSRVHRLSREAGLPCFAGSACPHCLPGADRAPAHAYTGEDRE